MLLKQGGKTRRLKWLVGWLATERVGKLSKPVKSTKVITKNSTTSASIVPEVWIMLGLLSSLGIKIAYDNRKDHK